MKPIVQFDIQIRFTDGVYRNQGVLLSMTTKNGRIVRMLVSSDETDTRKLVDIVPCRLTGNMPNCTIIY
jgi:hypothetical protein